MSGAIPRRTRKDVLPSTIAKKSLQIKNVNSKNWNPSSKSPDEKLNAPFAKTLSKTGIGTVNDAHIIDDELSTRLNAGLKLDGPKQRDVAQNRNEHMNDISLNIDCDAVDWSDEGEEDDDTPRNHDLLSQLAEESEDDCDQDTLQFSRRTNNSHSGRWSSFSWSSLYERAGTDSSLSWAEDELEKETTERVKSLFDDIDRVLYADNGVSSNELKALEESSGLSEDILDECALWREKFPHLRVIGKAIPKPFESSSEFNDCDIPDVNTINSRIYSNVPKENLPNKDPVKNNQETNRIACNALPEKDLLWDSKKKLSPQLPCVNKPSSALSSAVSTISTITLTENENRASHEDFEDSDEENCDITYASHGNYFEGDQEGLFRDNIGETLATNSRFTENPSQYLKDKLTEAVFRRIWSTVVAKNLQTLVDAAWNNELQTVMSKPNNENQWHSRLQADAHASDYKSWRRPDIGISSIDENSITDSENYRHSGMYNKSLHDNNTIRPGFNQRSNQRQDYLNSMNYVGAQSSTSIATHSPPFSDLNPVSLPHLGPSITPRPMVASAPPVRQSLLLRERRGMNDSMVQQKKHNGFRDRAQLTNQNNELRSFRSATAVPTIGNNIAPSIHALSGMTAKHRNTNSKQDISDDNENSGWMMKKRIRPRTLTRMRSKSGSPPTHGKDSRITFQEKRVSPSTTPITPVLSGIYNAEHSISLPPISNNFSSVNKNASNGTFLQLPSNRQSSSNSSLRNSASSDLGMGSSISPSSYARSGARSSLSSGRFSRSSSSNAISVSSPLEAIPSSNSRTRKSPPPSMSKRYPGFNRSPKVHSVKFSDTSPSKISEDSVQQYQSLPRGISISGKRLKKLPQTARRKVNSPDRLSSQQNFDGMTSAIKTYAQVSPERNKIKSWYKMPAKDFEAARTIKISQIQNGSSSPPQNYSDRDSKHRLTSPTMQKQPRWRN